MVLNNTYPIIHSSIKKEKEKNPPNMLLLRLGPTSAANPHGHGFFPTPAENQARNNTSLCCGVCVADAGRNTNEQRKISLVRQARPCPILPRIYSSPPPPPLLPVTEGATYTSPQQKGTGITHQSPPSITTSIHSSGLLFGRSRRCWQPWPGPSTAPTRSTPPSSSGATTPTPASSRSSSQASNHFS